MKGCKGGGKSNGQGWFLDGTLVGVTCRTTVTLRWRWQGEIKIYTCDLDENNCFVHHLSCICVACNGKCHTQKMLCMAGNTQIVLRITGRDISYTKTLRYHKKSSLFITRFLFVLQFCKLRLVVSHKVVAVLR